MIKEIKTKTLLKERVGSFRESIISSHVYLPPDISKFVFLCGANKNTSEISERRKALIEFSKSNLPHTQFFLAEKAFSTLNQEGHKGNILDVENLISAFSDHILIILESPSSFAELGAFSNKELRKKLVVINDIRFINEKSFINLGPLKAIEEEKDGKDRIIHYKMKNDGVKNRDSIGGTFNKIYDLLKDPIKSKSKAISLDSINPAKEFNKESAMFVHDIIYLSGPILHAEIIEILILIFGKNKFNNVIHLLAILSSFGSLSRGADELYRSNLKKPYYDYRFDTSKYISTFRNYILKSYPERLYGHQRSHSQ